MKQVGLSATVKWNGDAAMSGMRQTSAAFDRLDQKTKNLRQGMLDMKQGLAGMGTTGLWAGAGVGFTVKKFADFDGQMGAVKAVLGSAASKDFPMLTKEAQRLGATTSFTATQAAEAMENLARSGQSPAEIMSSIGPVLAAAAAEGMDLGTAADIVASNLKAFSLNAGDATRVADTLAFVSAKTNTNMVGLQEGLKYVAPVASGMKIPIEDTAAALGVLADVGLKGSLAGTGLKNALIKIASSAKGGVVKVGQFSAKVEKTANGGVNLAGTMLNITEKLTAIKDPLKRTQAGMKLLGLRGQGAASAFAALSDDKVKLLFSGLAAKAKGSAAEMQKMRLDNLQGQFTLLSSAVDGVVNSIGQVVSKSMGGAIGGITDKLSQAAQAFQYFGDNSKEIGKDAPVEIGGVSREITALVRGFLRGLQDIKMVFGGLFSGIKAIGNLFGLSADEGSSGMARITTGAIGLSIAMAPIGLAIKGATKLFGPFAKIGVSALKMVAGATKSVIGGLSKVAGGLLDKTRFASKLPGAAGKLAKAVGGLDKLTAQPVRVTNFDEMGGGGILGGKGAGAGAGAGAGGGGLISRAREGLTAFLGRFGKAGAFLTQSASLAGKGLAAKLGILGGAVAAAGTAGYAFGRWLDNKFGISEKLGNAMHRLFNATEIAASKQRVENNRKAVVGSHVERIAQQWAKFAGQGRKQIEIFGEGGKVKKVDLTRAMAEKRLTEFMKQQGNTDEQVKQALDGLKDVLAKLPERIVVKTDVKVGERAIASATGKAKNEGTERGAKKGGRRGAAVGATP